MRVAGLGASGRILCNQINFAGPTQPQGVQTFVQPLHVNADWQWTPYWIFYHGRFNSPTFRIILVPNTFSIAPLSPYFVANLLLWWSLARVHNIPEYHYNEAKLRGTIIINPHCLQSNKDAECLEAPWDKKAESPTEKLRGTRPASRFHDHFERPT
jgi:hypothetical protein